MNIFLLDNDALQSAKWACDKHVVKMPTESLQLLANCFPPSMLASPGCPRTKTGGIRKRHNPRHPSCRWVLASRANMDWLIEYTEALIEEKHARYPKGGRYFGCDFLEWVKENKNNASNCPPGEKTELIPAISESAKCRLHPAFEKADVITKYKLFYSNDKRAFATWKRNKPEWFDDKNLLISDIS